MNKVYFVRHAKPDFSVHDDMNRPLTEEGIEGSKEVTRFLKDKNITKIYSSPYKRSVDTIKGLAEELNLSIELIEDFRERKVSDEWIEDFNDYSKKQWEDFEYKLTNGESLREVQERNIAELHNVLRAHKEGNIVASTHGTALSTMINYYDSSFDYLQFDRIKHMMPWVVCMEFDGVNMREFESLVESN